MIPRFEPPIGPREWLAALSPAGRDDVAAFETAFARIMGQAHAVAFPYGRTGLMALLTCLGCGDREVICPAYTCVVVPNAVVLSGARIVFVDSGADANARLDDVEAAVGERTAAFIATSIFGNPVDLDRLDALKARHPQLPIIQDCAHSFICEWNGRPVHREGVAAIFGLNVSKTMTSIFGGMVTTDDPVLAARLREERARIVTAPAWTKMAVRLAYALAVGPAFFPPLFAITDRLRRAGLLDRFTRYYDENTIEMPSDYLTGMTDLEARVGLVQTKRLGAMIAARRTYDRYYRERLQDLPGLVWIDRPDGSSVSHVTARVANRDAVRSSAARAGVELGEVIEYSVPALGAYRRLQTDDREFPVAQMLAETTINLPTALRFSHRTADKVIGVLREVLQGASSPPKLPLG